MIKRFFHQDSILVGVISSLGSELIGVVIVWGVLTIMNLPLMENLKYFAAAFIPTVLVMRYYMKQKTYLLTTKTVIVTIFVTFIAFMFFMLRHNIN